VTVTVETMAPTRNDYGEQAVQSSKSVSALYEDTSEIKRALDGIDQVPAARITFLEPVTVDANSRLKVNGLWAPIIRIDRSVVPGDSKAFLVQVYVGELAARSL
jgi:hypothetical protein